MDDVMVRRGEEGNYGLLSTKWNELTSKERKSKFGENMNKRSVKCVFSFETRNHI
jgi:hypothetical protein